MKVLLITQYYWPENFIINKISLGLNKLDHEVSVLTGLPNYPNGSLFKGYSFFNSLNDEYSGIQIYRSPMITRQKGKGFNLFLNYISFAISSSLRLLFIKEKFDIIFVYQPSPLTVAIPAFLQKKYKIPIVFWCQDLWPESVQDAGGLNNFFVLKLLMKFSKWVYNISNLVLVQSEAFIKPIINQGCEPEKIKYLPNTVDSEYFNYKKKDFKKLNNDTFRIVYAGNIGKAQNLEILVNAVKDVISKINNLEVIIIGDGRESNTIKELVKEEGLSNIFKFTGQIDSKEVIPYYESSDALFVSLASRDAFKIVIPSKVQAYMAVGKPIIASIDGEGKRIIELSNAGLCSSAGNYSALAKNILKLVKMSCEERSNLGENGRLFFMKNFHSDIIIKKIQENFKHALNE